MTMRNRKTVIVAFMLIACMLMAVGFAALTDTLNIEGDAEVSQINAENAFDDDVYFSAVSSGSGYTAEILSTNNDKGNFTVTGLEGKDDVISITFTIQNDNEFGVNVVVDPTNTETTNTEYFECTTSVGDATFSIPAHGSYNVTVNVKLLKTPILAENQTISGTFTLEYDVVSAS